ncbi:hypothetical protein B0I32_1423 [Nonomuraea fuscirosea]|uniref:Uncharacterized protein n=1 Tax=Nonomuraea fuscirosea TaxID=1291556 RepID=A0A2T0LUB6_9ACTN|nr:hypothetical protein B0I32_1423 [Nonomuraea fuscirosea]
MRKPFTTTADGESAETITHDEARLDIGSAALDEPAEIGITPLIPEQLPVLGAGMDNVTDAPRAGYRFTPTPFEFETDVTISLPYDAAKLTAAGLTLREGELPGSPTPTRCGWPCRPRTTSFGRPGSRPATPVTHRRPRRAPRRPCRGCAHAGES